MTLTEFEEMPLERWAHLQGFEYGTLQKQRIEADKQKQQQALAAALEVR